MNHHGSFSIRLEDLATQPVGPALWISLGVSMSGCLMGITVAFSASALADMTNDYFVDPPTTDQRMWFSALAALVSLVSGLLYGRYVKNVGKKHTLMLSALFYFVGYSIMAYSKDYILLFIGRGVSGIGLSLTCLSLSPYISEISPTQHRGKFASIMQLQIQVGILIINMCGVFYIQFRFSAIATCGIALINLICIALAPETPRWLVSKGRIPEAERVLCRLMQEDNDLVHEELEVLQRERSRVDIPQDDIGAVPFFSSQNIKPLLILSMIMVFQQLTAINAVLADSNMIFQDLEFTSPRLCTVGMSAAFLLFTFGSASLTDKAGRKLLLVLFAVLIAMSLGLFSLAGFFSPVHEAVLALSLCSYVFSFSMAWGSIPWVLSGELFTVENQGRAIAIVSAVNWTFNFLTVFSWPILRNIMTPKWVFLMYSLCCLLAALFVGTCLPETRGLTLYQITDLFAPNSPNYQYVTVVHRVETENSQENSRRGSSRNINFV